MNFQESKPVALLFDVFGTVVDWRGSIIKQLKEYEPLCRFDRQWEEVADAWRGLYQPSMEEVRSGMRPWVNLDQLHKESFEQLIEKYELSGLLPENIDEISRFWHRLEPWNDTVAGLVSLKRRYILSTLSNGNTALLVNMAKYANLPWDVILGAETAESYKPEPKAYLSNIALLDLRPEVTMMVAAHNDDLHAAKALGMQTAFIIRPTEYGPGQVKDLEPTGNWDVVAHSFEELAEMLG